MKEYRVNKRTFLWQFLNLPIGKLKEALGIDNSTQDIYLNGFRITSCLKGNIVLPENTTLEYTGPLSICAGASLTIPSGTTLTII